MLLVHAAKRTLSPLIACQALEAECIAPLSWYAPTFRWHQLRKQDKTPTDKGRLRREYDVGGKCNLDETPKKRYSQIFFSCCPASFFFCFCIYIFTNFTSLTKIGRKRFQSIRSHVTHSKKNCRKLRRTSVTLHSLGIRTTRLSCQKHKKNSLTLQEYLCTGCQECVTSAWVKVKTHVADVHQRVLYE